MGNPDGKNPKYDTVRSKRNIISGLGATQTLDAIDSDSLIVLDRAAGTIVTLPTAVPGLTYEFHVSVSVTSNNFKVITANATEFLLGDLMSIDTDSGNVVVAHTGNGSTLRAVTMNGTTTGGLKGTRMKFTCLSTTLWLVEGSNQGSGVVATPFATS